VICSCIPVQARLDRGSETGILTMNETDKTDVITRCQIRIHSSRLSDSVSSGRCIWTAVRNRWAGSEPFMNSTSNGSYSISHGVIFDAALNELLMTSPETTARSRSLESPQRSHRDSHYLRPRYASYRCCNYYSLASCSLTYDSWKELITRAVLYM